MIPYAHALALESTGRQAEADEYLGITHRMMTDMFVGLDEATVAEALSVVPIHVEITSAWERRQPKSQEFSLASLKAPGGRPLEQDEMVIVRWTVHDPSDENGSDAICRRRLRILRLVQEAETQGAAATVADLAGALGAGIATIGRDLASLRKDGHKVTTRGRYLTIRSR